MPCDDYYIRTYIGYKKMNFQISSRVDRHPLTQRFAAPQVTYLEDMIPTLEQLVQTHVEYMDRLSLDEHEQCTSFTNRLNIQALLDISTRALGNECIRIDKIYQGGFNQIFNLWFQDVNIKAVARINMPWGGGAVISLDQRIDRVRSEVATLKWIKENTSISVPSVYAYDENPDNIVGAAYIIEERIIGRPLSEVWRDLYVAQGCEIVKQLVHTQAELLHSSFPQIGSLYEGAEKAGPSRFYVGRMAPPVSFERARIDRGPWKTPREQYSTFISEQLIELRTDEAGILAKRKAHKKETADFDINAFIEFYVAVQEFIAHIELLDKWDPLFGITHPDIGNLHNILVAYEDPSRIVGVLDWEGTRVLPWWQATIVPDIVWEDSQAPDIDTSRELWEDTCNSWGTLMRDKGPLNLQFKHADSLMKLETLVRYDNPAWRTIEELVGEVMEWRLTWPQPHDPAFKKLDCILRRYHPNFSLDTPKDHA